MGGAAIGGLGTQHRMGTVERNSKAAREARDDVQMSSNLNQKCWRSSALRLQCYCAFFSATICIVQPLFAVAVAE